MKQFYNQDICLENDFVQLIPFSSSYSEQIKPLIMDEEITRFTGAHIKTSEDFDSYMIRTLEARENGLRYPFLVIDKQSNQVAGSTSFGHINFPSKRLEIGWTWYGKDYRGSGINFATKYELLNYAFTVLNMNRVQFSVDSQNIRSQKAVLKLGATQEGIFRHNYENALGEPRDDIYYSIIKQEWEDIKSTRFSKFS